MRNYTLLLSMLLAIMFFHLQGQAPQQKVFKTITDPQTGYQQLSEMGGLNSINPDFKVGGSIKEASINWQFTDAAAIGSRIKVSAQTGQTFTSWWLNQQRISLYGSSSSPLWEQPIGTQWEWPIDLTEDGAWAATGFDSVAQVYITSTPSLFWEVIFTGQVIGVKISQDGSKLYVAENNHNNTGNVYIHAFAVGNSTPLWSVPFTGDGTVFTASGDCSRLVLCQYSGVNKLWVINSSDGTVMFDAFYANQNPPGLSYNGNVIVNGDYSGNVYLYKFNETTNAYEQKWTYKVGVGNGGTSVWVVGMGVSADGNTVAVGTLIFLANDYDGELYLFNSWSPVPVWIHGSIGDEVSAVDLSGDGSLIAAASWGPFNQTKPDFFLFRKESDIPIFTITTPGSFFAVDISDDGTLCAVTGKAVHARAFGNGGFLYNIHSDPGGGWVAGIVDLENTSDDANAKVSINELENYYNRSNTDGSYLIKYVPEGTYSVTASKIGYYPQTISDVVVSEGQATNLDFALQETGNPPTNLSATHGAGLTIGLSWQYDNAPGVLGFNIYRKFIPEDLFPDEPLATVSNTEFTYEDSDILPLKNYYYAVTAIIETDIESPYSNMAEGWMSHGFITDNISAYVGSVPVIDGTISPGEWDDAFKLDASDFLGTNDNSPNPVGSVTMYYKVDAAMTGLYVACINENDVVLEDHDEVALYIDDNHDGTYPAIGDSTEGNYWAAYYASGSVIKYRPIYDNGGVGQTFYLDNPQIAVSNATGHIVYEFKIPIGNEFWDITPGPDNTSGLFTFTLDDPTNFDGYWPCQNPQIFIPLDYGSIQYGAANSAPIPPDGLNISWNDNAPYTINLEWNQPDVNDFDHFNVYKSENSGPWEFLTETTGTQVFYVSATSIYTEFYVTTVDQFEMESVPSEIAVFDVTIGINENHSEATGMVYPNPSNGSVYISLNIEEPGNYSIAVFNSEGQRVKSLYNNFLNRGLTVLQWNGENNAGAKLNNGIYFIQCAGQNMRFSQKVVLMRK